MVYHALHNEHYICMKFDMLLLFPPQNGFFALYIQARQSVLGHEIPRSCDAICHIWSWSCFGTHRPLFSGHILQDQGSPRSKTLSITNLRSGADISLADKSNPIWSKLTALHRFLCEFSLVWWGDGGSKDMTKPWGWGKNSFLGQCWSRHLLKATVFANSLNPSMSVVFYIFCLAYNTSWSAFFTFEKPLWITAFVSPGGKYSM